MRTLLLILLLLSQLPGSAIADSLGDWMELEQKRIDRRVDENKILAPDIAGQAEEYRPENQKWFALKSVWVPESELHAAIQEDELPVELRKLFVRTVHGKRQFRLLVHPESENFYADILKKYPAESGAFEATSTASSRTVKVRPRGHKKPDFFAKLSLDVKLGGVVRTVPRGEVARSVGTSRYLSALEKERGAERFTFLREPLGVSPRGWERGGMILRVIPPSIVNDEAGLVPLFSLYSRAHGGETLLRQMAERAGMKPSQFVREKILAPFYEGWVDWNVNGAVTMEAHAQNVLLEVDKSGVPTGRFVHRDLGGFNIDTRSKTYRERAALDVFTTFEEDYHQKFTAGAQGQSLYTYFDGGFLHNIDQELERIEPGYRAGSIVNDAYEKFSMKVRQRTGYQMSPRQIDSLRRGRGMSGILKKAAKSSLGAPPEGFSCPAAYGKIEKRF